MIWSSVLDIYDFAYHQNADYHQDSRIHHHPLPQRILEQSFSVAWIEEVHTDEHGEWQPAQDPAGQPALRGANAHLSGDAYALTNHMRGLIQDLSQVAAGLLLNQNRGDQELQIGNGHTAAKVGHGRSSSEKRRSRRVRF